MWKWWLGLGFVPTPPTVISTTASSSPLPLEQRLRRVTTGDIAQVTPRDVERVKRQLGLYDLHCAMEVLLDDNRYAEVIASASPLTLHEASRDLTAAQRNTLSIIAKSNLLALYNLLPYVTCDLPGSGERNIS